MFQNLPCALPHRISMIFAAVIALPLVSGCSNANTVLTVPNAKNMTIVCFYENQDLPPMKFVVASAKQRADIVKSLRDLSWTKPGKPLAEIGMIRPDIDILLTDDFGTLHTYQLYWANNSLVDQDSGLLLTVTDISKLRAHVTSITGLSAQSPNPNA